MEIVVVKNSIWKYVLYSLLALVFVVGGVFILFVGKDTRSTFIGWVCIIFFGFGLLVFVRQIFDSRPRIVIDETGIFDRTLDVGVIEWSDIEHAYKNSMMGNDFISLVLKDNEKYLKKTAKAKAQLARYNSALGFETININLSGVDKPADEIFDILINQIVANKIENLNFSDTNDNRH
jgi:uncharacterized membrane protein